MIRFCLFLVVSLIPATALAQEPSAESHASASTLAAMQAELDELRARQAALQAKVAGLEARREPQPVKSSPGFTVSYTPAPGRGLMLSVGDFFSLSVRPRVQVRDTVTLDPGAPVQNEINVRTARLWIQGHVITRDLQFALHLAFGGKDTDVDSPSPILDAYIDYLRLRDMHIRVGQFFVQFDRARTTYEYSMQFPDRAQVANELGIDRDVGLSISSTDLFGSHGVLGYSLGVFGGEGKNHFGGAGVGFLYVARLVVTPFGPFDDVLEGDVARLRRPRLMIGIGGAYNQSTNRPRSTSGTPFTLGTVDYGHAAADLVFKLAGISLMAEVLYRQSRQGSLSGIVNGSEVRQWSRSAFGYLVQAGVMVHSRVELVARFDDLRPIGQTDPTLVALAAASGRELAGGLNVYVLGYAFKLQSAYTYQFGDVLTGGRHLVQVQLDASF